MRSEHAVFMSVFFSSYVLFYQSRSVPLETCQLYPESVYSELTPRPGPLCAGGLSGGVPTAMASLSGAFVASSCSAIMELDCSEVGGYVVGSHRGQPCFLGACPSSGVPLLAFG